jgi:hypothetical protein
MAQVASSEPIAAVKDFVAFETFEQACADLSDYDALHESNISNGWTYLGTADSPITRMTTQTGERQAENAANSGDPSKQRMAPIMSAVGSLMGAMMSQGEHRRVYGRTLNGRRMQLRQSFVPTVGEAGTSQVNCTLIAEAPEGIPSNDQLFAKYGRKLDAKDNLDRKAGKAVRLRWYTGKTVRQIAYVPHNLSNLRGVAEGVGVATYTLAAVTLKTPAEGDPVIETAPDNQRATAK